MGNTILAAQFDIIWIQFYNNGAAGCTARNFADANPDYPAQKSSMTTVNYQAWKNTINSGASNGARIYLGLLAGPQETCASPGDFISAKDANNLINAFQGDDQFGGVMLYEATSALNSCHCGIPYFNDIKNSLIGIAPVAQCPASTTSTFTSTTTSRYALERFDYFGITSLSARVGLADAYETALAHRQAPQAPQLQQLRAAQAPA